jgi:hypothetical protein
MTPRGTLSIPIHGLGEVPKVSERGLVRPVGVVGFYQIIR